jgi:hypothetical protein
MVPLEGGVAEMTKRWHSTEATGGALMAKWFRTRGGEIGAAVGAVDNGGALITPFIAP